MERVKVCTYLQLDDYAQLGRQVDITIDTVVDCFRYESLVRRGVIPDLVSLAPTIRAKRFDPNEKTIRYFQEFFLEYLRCSYRGETTTIADDAHAYAASLFPTIAMTDVEHQTMTTYTSRACEKLVDEWQPEYGERFEFNRVVKKGALSLTVDFITYVEQTPVVWLVSFEPWNAKTKERIILRALANWTFVRGARMVGVVLVLAQKYVVFDMVGWAKRALQNDIEQIVRCLRNRMRFEYRESLFMKYPAGNSVKTDSRCLSELAQAWVQSCYEIYSQVRPIQVFLENPFKDDPDYKEVRSVVDDFTLPLFIHAPLNMNLAGASDGPIKILRSLLRLGKKMGARCVTVHTGRMVKQTAEESLQRQATILRACLSESDPKYCLLTVETPCGKEGDICTSFEAMNAFFLDYFTEAERKRIGVTIDTCHVFNAGNDPVKYMEEWIERGSVEVGLCHWNDAVNFFGVGIEGHHHPDKPGGAIGYDAMEAIAVLCRDNGVPFLFE